MILGSHNTMTYLPPKHWWLRPFNFMAKCQEVDIVQQYERYGARLFDLRIGYDKYGSRSFCHGLITYQGNVTEILTYLNSKKDVTVRIVLEKGDERLFISDVGYWRKNYANISWVCGVKKKGWIPLCGLSNIEGDIKHLYSSMQGTKLDDLFPWLYAKRNNRKKMLENENYSKFVMIDFVNLI